ncbi:MAG: DegT/DnrJ/EryC1/StrS family aminotransferase [Propionibacteriaceae bacterium]
MARPVIDEEDVAAAVRVLRSGRVVQGPEVAAFEAEFSGLVAGRHCVAVNSGTSALQLALMVLGIGAGDEVIVPSFSFAASANAIRLVGAVPIFVDITADDFTLDPAAVAAAIGPRTVAIMPVHLFGLPADMTAITELATRHHLGIVEDAAQAHGAEVDSRPVGSFGLGCFSFYPTKNMHSLEGGMITTADAAQARTLRLLRNQGMEQRYANEIVGANLRLTDVAAAIGRVQLGRLPGWNAQRRANAQILTQTVVRVSPPSQPPGRTHVFHQFTVRTAEGRDDLRRHLHACGIGSEVYYPTPIHRLRPYLADDGQPDPRWQLPQTDRAAAEVLSLPVHPGVEAAELDRIAAAVASWSPKR